MAAEPLIPYLQVPELTLLAADVFGSGVPPVPISIKPFGVLVATGVYVGSYLVIRQGRRLGFDQQALVSFMLHGVIVGFVGGHMLDVIFYYPERVLRDPLLLLRLWKGQSSLGGIAAGLLGCLWWRWRKRTAILPYLDVLSSAWPIAWAFGRAGCSLAHDHPGVLSDAWFAVRYPDGGRFDLGLYEFVLTIPVAVAFLVLRRRPRPWGLYTGTMMLMYAPTRFALDFLRARELPAELGVADVRYGPLTPAQWACVAMLLLGVGLLWRALQAAGSPESIRPPDPPRPEPRRNQTKPVGG